MLEHINHRITHLEELHRTLDKQIDRLQSNKVFDEHNLHQLKKQKLILKDEIQQLIQKRDTLK